MLALAHAHIQAVPVPGYSGHLYKCNAWCSCCPERRCPLVDEYSCSDDSAYQCIKDSLAFYPKFRTIR